MSSSSSCVSPFESFVESDPIAAALSRVEPNADGSYTCPYCQAILKTDRLRVLKRHLKVNCRKSPVTALQRTCECCGITWKSNQSKCNHERARRNSAIDDMQVESVVEEENDDGKEEEEEFDDEDIAEEKDMVTTCGGPISRKFILNFSAVDEMKSALKIIAYVQPMIEWTSTNAAANDVAARGEMHYIEAAPRTCAKQVAYSREVVNDVGGFLSHCGLTDFSLFSHYHFIAVSYYC